MAAKRWGDLDPGVRKAIIGMGAAEAALKLAALVDIKRRPAEQIHGKKRNWALAMLVNSAGLIPLAYFVFGRRKPEAQP
jgi:hypothetical protein